MSPVAYWLLSGPGASRSSLLLCSRAIRLIRTGSPFTDRLSITPIATTTSPCTTPQRFPTWYWTSLSCWCQFRSCGDCICPPNGRLESLAYSCLVGCKFRTYDKFTSRWNKLGSDRLHHQCCWDRSSKSLFLLPHRHWHQGVWCYMWVSPSGITGYPLIWSLTIVTTQTIRQLCNIGPSLSPLLRWCVHVFQLCQFW